jgi:hypothetical protein
MTVHSFHIFDRKGKTLFTKRYIKSGNAIDEEQLSEQRKLVFGMLFSLRELSASLTPSDGPGDLQLVKTGASTLYNYETVSGLRFALFTTPETSYASPSNNPMNHLPPNVNAPPSANMANAQGGGAGGSSTHGSGGMTNPAVTDTIRAALQHIFEHIYVMFVIRSPMYRATDPNIASTNFEASLDNYLKGMPWFK